MLHASVAAQVRSASGFASGLQFSSDTGIVLSPSMHKTGLSCTVCSNPQSDGHAGKTRADHLNIAAAESGARGGEGDHD